MSCTHPAPEHTALPGRTISLCPDCWAVAITERETVYLAGASSRSGTGWLSAGTPGNQGAIQWLLAGIALQDGGHGVPISLLVTEAAEHLAEALFGWLSP
jgi:hypothetical protein